MDIARPKKTVEPVSETDENVFDAPEPVEIREEDLVLSEEIGSAPLPPSQIILFDAVSKRFSASAGEFALEDISLSIDPGEFLFLVGASGAGKSTLLRLIYAELEPSEGVIYFGGRDIGMIKRKHLPYYRRNIGTVFQDFKLLPQKTAFENVAYALEVFGKPTEEILDEVPQILDIAGLSAKSNLYPRELSGGERQRVAIARALILQPKVIIADEPTGNLDPQSADDVLDLLSEINALGTTVIFATHNQGLVDRVGKRVVTLDEGRIISDERQGKYRVPRKHPRRSKV